MDNRIMNIYESRSDANGNEGLKTNAEVMLEQIFYYMTELLEVKEFSKTVELLTELGRTIVNGDRASFWFWDKKHKQYWTLAATSCEKIIVPENTGIVGRTILEDKVILCNDPYEQPEFNYEVDNETGYFTRSILCIPVEDSEGDVIGAFQVLNKSDDDGNPAPFTDKDVKRMSLVAVFCEKTLESYLLRNEAQTDKLTGLKNRYGFYEYYNTKVVKMAKNCQFTIIMCDIDHFKKVNDTYGHNVGDIVLEKVADLISSNLSVDDMIARWGGEEFIIILHNQNAAGAKAVAERLRKMLETHEFDVSGYNFGVTMSFGVNEINTMLSVEENIRRSDEKLYEAKNTGRNKVV